MDRAPALCLAVLTATALALTSCSSETTTDGNGGPGPGDTTPPEATSVSIADGATDVGLIQGIEVTFSEPMDAATISDTTVGVNERSVGGFVEYDAGTRTASFTPDTLYAQQSPHEFFITADVTDEAGNPIAAFTRSFETGPLDCAHLDDRFEPNDEISGAVPIELNRRYRTLTLCEEDVDSYVFTVEETVMVRILEWIKHSDEEENNFATDLLRGANEPYAESGWGSHTGSYMDYFHFTFRPGTYYLDVYSNDDPVYTLYDFELVTEDPCADDAYEDNDFIDEAVPIEPGTIMGLRACWLDRDFFAVDLAAGQTLGVTVTAEPNAGTRRLKFYTPTGAPGPAWTNSDNPLYGSYVASQTGTHYFKVRFWDDDIEYDIDVEVTD
jgi:hypothetical protein